MTITWYGHFCFKLATSATKPITILINPYLNYKELGLTNLNLQKPDIVINYEEEISDSEIRARKASDSFVIESAGEYNIKEIDIFGTKEDGNKIYLITLDEIKCLYLGQIKSIDLSSKAPSFILKDIDILFVPIGGDFTLAGKKYKILNTEDAVKLVKTINPKIIIPMHFKTPNLKLKTEDASGFLKLLGKKAIPVEKLLIRKKDLEGKEKEVYLLSC